MRTYKQFTIDEGWKDYIPSMKDVYATGLNLADTATMGGYKYARAGVDYAAKNAMKLAGYGKGTSYEKELKQEKEKLAKAEKESPRASAVGDVAGYGAMALTPYLELKLANDAYKAGEVGTKAMTIGKSLRTIIGR
jgi:hypothetical protein